MSAAVTNLHEDRPARLPLELIGPLLFCYSNTRFIAANADYPTHLIAFDPDKRCWFVWNSSLQKSAPFRNYEDANKSIRGRRGY